MLSLYTRLDDALPFEFLDQLNLYCSLLTFQDT